MFKSKAGLIISVIFSYVLLLAGCSEPGLNLASKDEKVVEEAYQIPIVGSYDSSDEAIVAKVDEEAKTITFYNYELKKSYTLNYDGTSRLSDRYGTSISISQVNVGDIADILFLKTRKTLTSLKINSESFYEEDLTGFEINTWAKTFTIGKDVYKLSSDAYVSSNGLQISVSELNPMDTVTIRGMGNEIESVVVKRGHGYLSLKGADFFTGGFIEVSSKLIYQIEEDMLLMIPQGDYSVRITNKGNEVKKDIKIEENKETIIDLSDVEIKEEERGSVKFIVSPEEAEVLVDSNEINTSYSVLLSTGLHKLTVSSEGYETLTKYFNVTEDYNEITVYLLEDEDYEASEEETSEEDLTGEDSEEDEDSDNLSDEASDEEDTSEESEDTGDITDTDSSEETSSETSEETSDTEDQEYYINIPTPQGLEVYWDGNYMGLSPVSIKREEGTHVITLRKSGYVTRSFTITLDDAKEDISYSFDDLQKEE